MSEVDDSVAISIAEDVMLGDSSLPEEANRMAIPSAEGLQLAHSRQPQQQEITIGNHSPQPRQQEMTIDNHGPGMSIDELLEVIKGANGMPVLFVPFSDGRLAAVAVEGIQNRVPANRSNEESAEKKQLAFRSWLLLLTSLVATVTFTAGLTPPGGFWAVDDKKNGYIAGTSVMRDKFPTQYLLFHVFTTMAFLLSLMIIAILAKSKEVMLMEKTPFRALVWCCFACLGGSYILGTSVNQTRLIYDYTGALFGVIVLFPLPYFLDWTPSIRNRNRSPESMA